MSNEQRAKAGRAKEGLADAIARGFLESKGEVAGRNGERNDEIQWSEAKWAKLLTTSDDVWSCFKNGVAGQEQAATSVNRPQWP